MLDLAGRTALVTGGSRGIGFGIARALAARGVKVAVVDRDDDSLAVAAAALVELTAVTAHVLDVRDRDAFAAVADEVERTLGPVSLLFNNAGIVDAVPPRHMSYDMWDWVMGVNVEGVYNGLQTFVPRMLAGGGDGHIVNTSSEAGIVEAGSGFLYHASKYAVVGLSESLRSELAPHGIGVSVLCPGPVATGIVANATVTRPASAAAPSARVAAILDVAHRHLLDHGVPPEVVGEMVLDAVVHDRPFVFTRGAMAGPLGDRTATMADAMRLADAQLAARGLGPTE